MEISPKHLTGTMYDTTLVVRSRVYLFKRVSVTTCGFLCSQWLNIFVLMPLWSHFSCPVWLPTSKHILWLVWSAPSKASGKYGLQTCFPPSVHQLEVTSRAPSYYYQCRAPTSRDLTLVGIWPSMASSN